MEHPAITGPPSQAKGRIALLGRGCRWPRRDLSPHPLRIHVLKYGQKCFVNKIALHVYCGHIFWRLMVFDGDLLNLWGLIDPASLQSLFQAPGGNEGDGYSWSQHGIWRIVWKLWQSSVFFKITTFWASTMTCFNTSNLNVRVLTLTWVRHTIYFWWNAI